MATVDTYLNLITSAWKNKPKFMATVALNVAVQVRVQNLMQLMVDLLFNIDDAVGDQLDILGAWAGVTRNVSIPVTGIYFTWDGIDPTVGWDFGIWQGEFAGTITTLPDSSYRVLIKAKIAANSWDGTTEGAYRVWEALFPDITILINDHCDMSYDMAFVGGILDSLTLALIQGGYIPLKPEAIHVNTYYLPVNTGPLFGWDLDTDFVQGWETGSWAKELNPT